MFWSAAVVIIVAAIAGIFIKYPVSTWQGIIDGSAPIIPAGWVNYENSDYGFSISYPANWQISTSSLQDDVPSIVFGNPIDGTTTYTLRMSIVPNNSGFSSVEFVADMLSQVKAQDEANGTNSPSLSAQFASSTSFAVDENSGYELDNVFEFDHAAEQIYMAHNDNVLVFDFPTADANPNIASPTDNNATAHKIFQTLTFIKQVANVVVNKTNATSSDNGISIIVFDPLNATYTVGGQPVTLVAGKAATPAAPGSAENVTTTVFGQPASGDLNGDGKADAAVLLVQDSGGSGTFYYVAAAINVASGTEGTNAILLGDRIAPQNITVQNGRIVVNYADRNPGEPMTTAPSVGVTKYFSWNGTSLQAASSSTP